MAKLSKKTPRSPIGGWRALLGQFTTAFLVLFLVLLVWASFQATERDKPKNISLSELALDIEANKVKTILVEGDNLTVNYQDESVATSRKESEAALSEALGNLGVNAEALRKVTITVQDPSGFSVWFLPVLSIVAPILFILAIFWYLSRQVKGSTMQAFSFGQSQARVIDPNDQKEKVTFKDVAGAREAKEELSEIVDFLRNPKKFLDIGARIPKGVLLMGAPGTGKTLLARAVAGESKVPFFYLSGSEFVEMFVGVGASRVRDLFKMAKRAAPAIVFVDEIDAVGRHRGTGMGGGHDEREQTLNQILVEMDGFEPSEKVIVMAATNRPDVLDPALLRPGRFDRRVTIDLPDLRDREDILKVHATKKILGEDVNLHVIAERTPGFSGADLANLVNEAAILAAREERQKVTQYDLIRSVEKVMLGPERRSHFFSQDEKKLTAYHEAGHALLASILPHADPVHKISIISRGRAGGYTLKLPLEERRLQTRQEFLDDIAVSLGGYAAEEIVFGDITTGASNDIAVSTALARDMVTRYGMSKKIGPVAFESDSGMTFMGGRFMGGETNYSEEVTAIVDQEVSRIMNEGLERAREGITFHRKTLDAIVHELAKVETIEREDFEKILLVNGITPKKAKKEEGIEIVRES
jgi:cell division protease FtsH